MNMSNTYSTVIVTKFNGKGKEIRYSCDNEEELIKHFESVNTPITENDNSNLEKTFILQENVLNHWQRIS